MPAGLSIVIPQFDRSTDWNAALDKQQATMPEDALAEKHAALVSRSHHASSPR